MILTVNRWFASITSLIAGPAFTTMFALLPASAVAQEIAVIHCQGRCPQYSSALAVKTSKVVIHHLYAAGLNGFNMRADWVAYRLSKDAIGIASLLPREWQPDRLANFSLAAELADLESGIALPDISSEVSPYGGMSEPLSNEQNRVRLVPLTSYANTPYWSELNNTSNMLPMPAPLRIGAWLRLEQTMNALVAREEGELHVITGPIYFNTISPGADSSEPGADLMGYFKIVAGDSGFAAFVFPQDLGLQDGLAPVLRTTSLCTIMCEEVGYGKKKKVQHGV